jgi:hypothetical protein
MIISTKIVVRRNIEGYLLCPGMDPEVFKSLLKMLEPKFDFSKTNTDLQGKFYQLEGMDKETELNLE